jgi:arginyl-tRNA synthetase
LEVRENKMIREQLESVIRWALESLSIEAKHIPLEHPADLSHGDYSTSAALIYSKDLKKNPHDLAHDILDYILRFKPEGIEKAEVAGAGFINFYLSKKFFVGVTSNILENKDSWGKNKNLSGQKVIIEYTQPNPFKEFHIGHLVNNNVGEAVSRIIEAQGAEVKRVTYHGDVGLHVAKAIWAMKKNAITVGAPWASSPMTFAKPMMWIEKSSVWYCPRIRSSSIRATSW